jgi:predicted phage terminase large subunit-like protein
MRRLPPFEEKIRHQIRNELAITPVITMTALKERIENVFGRGFDYEHIRKLIGKVRNEIVTEIDRTQIERRAFAVTAIHPIQDKRARLRVAARYIKNGTVEFPRTGCERLLQQILGFGGEKFDDGVDAIVNLILGVAQAGIEEQVVHYV